MGVISSLLNYFPMQENMVCVCCMADVSIAEEMEELGIPVMTQNWLITAILQHKFVDQLKLEH